MKKINFTCPRCGCHKVVGDKVSQWMRMDVIGIDENGFVWYDFDNAGFYVDEEDEPVLFCDECFARITKQEIIKQSNND